MSVGQGPSLTLTPVAAGNTSVEVTAHNAGGSTTRTIRVTVAAAAPRAVGTFAPVALSVGGARADVDVAHAFTPAGVPVEARSRNTGIVAAALNGSVVTLTPVGPGNTSVEVTARNASGSATLSISVAVAAALRRRQVRWEHWRRFPSPPAGLPWTWTSRPPSPPRASR